MKRLISTLVLVLWASVGWGATLGKSTSTGTPGPVFGAYLFAMGPYTAPADGTITSLKLFSVDAESGNNLVVGVYSDNGNEETPYPNTLLAQSTASATNCSAGTWVSNNVSLAITSGTKYWLAWRSSADFNIPYDTDAGGYSKYYSSTYSDTLPATYAGGATSNTRSYAIYAEYTPDETDGIAITTPVQHQVFQRDGSNLSDIAIIGTYTGVPTAIEARFNGGTWEIIDDTLSGGWYSGTLSGQAAGQGTLEVRFTNSTGVTASKTYVGIGDVYLIAGQSNHEGRITNAQSYSHATLKASMFKVAGTWAELADPTGGSSYNSIWPLLATLHMEATGYPVAFITCAVGATSLSISPYHWKDGGTSYQQAITRVVASGVNNLRAILWLQGENESVNGTISQATYQADLSEMLNDFQVELGFPTVKLGVASLLRLDSAASRTAHDAIRAAHQYVWDNDPDCFAGPVLSDISGDGLHILSNADALTFAQRWWHFLNMEFFGGTEGRGPRVKSVAKIAADKMRVVFVLDNPPLVSQTSTTGWRVVDDTGVLTISSCAASGTDGVDITVSRALDTNPVVSFGSLNDMAGSTLKDSSTYSLPPEPFYALAEGSYFRDPMTVNVTLSGGEDYAPTGTTLITGDTLVLAGTGGAVNLTGVTTGGAITVQLQGTIKSFTPNGTSTSIEGSGTSSPAVYFLKIP